MSIFGTPVAGGTGSYGGSTASGTFNTGVGDLLVACVLATYSSWGSLDPTITDTAGNTWTALRTSFVGAQLKWFYSVATHASASNTITAHENGTGTGSAIFYGYYWDFPMTGTPYFDTATSLGSATTSSPAVCPSLFTTGADELIIVIDSDSSRGSTFMAETSPLAFTLDTTIGGGYPGGLGGMHGVFVSPGTVVPAFPFSGPSGQAAAISFRAGAPPAPSTIFGPPASSFTNVYRTAGTMVANPFYTAVGDLIVACLFGQGTGTSTTTVADSAGNTYTACPLQNDAVSGQGFQWFYTTAANASPSNTVTATFSTGFITAFLAMGFPISGVPLFDTSTAARTNDSLVESPAFNTTGIDELVIAAESDVYGGTEVAFTAGTGYTLLGTSGLNYAHNQVQYGTFGGPSTGIASAFTAPGMTAGAVSAIVFKAPLPPPTLASCAPIKGSDAGGGHVTLTGANFIATPTVTFGGVAATNVVYVNGTTVTCVAPAHALGAVDIVIANPDAQSATLPAGFLYVLPPAGGGGSSLGLGLDGAAATE
jgi:hypothetical protein